MFEQSDKPDSFKSNEYTFEDKNHQEKSINNEKSTQDMYNQYIELREMFDIKIFVHADSDERLIRRLKRDIAERGRDMDEVLSRYQTTLKPMHEQFIEPTKAFADIIIPNDKYNTVAIDVVRAVINQRIL